MDDVGAAAGNSAQWCDLVCRAHGLPTSQQRGLWSTRRRSPAGYPDAVTLRRGVPPAGVLALVDDTPGCSVKDSFGDLDLAPFGFEVLFDAAWIHAAAVTTAADATVGWTLVTEAEEFAAWTAAAAAGDVLGPDLLGDPAVRVLVAHDGGGVRAGAIAHRSAAVVGVSNVFSTTMAADAAWARDRVDPQRLLSRSATGRLRAGCGPPAGPARGVHRGRPPAGMAASRLT